IRDFHVTGVQTCALPISSRELMYNWFNEHLGLGLPGPIEQTDFEPLSAEQLTVFADEHPQPADVLSDADLQQQMIERSRRQFVEIGRASGRERGGDSGVR